MSRGNMYILGENPDFRVLTDQIFARNDFTGGTLIIPFRVEFSNFMRNGNNRLSKAEILWLKGELRTEGGIRISEGTILDNHMISNSKLSFQSQFQFSFSYDVINQIESKRKDDLLLIVSIAGQAALYEEIAFSNNQNRSFISGFDKGSGHVSFQIPQSYWINRVLSQIGHDSLRLIELPSLSRIIPDEYSRSL